MEISGRKIGKDYKPLVIAEIGINHGGSLDTAIKMVDAAISSGIEIIKHQTHIGRRNEPGCQESNTWKFQ